MPKIDKVYAFIAENSPGDEGVLGSRIKVNQVMNGEVVAVELWLPLMAASKEAADALVPQAQAMTDVLGKPVKIMAFTIHEEMGTLWPKPEKQPGES